MKQALRDSLKLTPQKRADPVNRDMSLLDQMFLENLDMSRTVYSYSRASTQQTIGFTLMHAQKQITSIFRRYGTGLVNSSALLQYVLKNKRMKT